MNTTFGRYRLLERLGKGGMAEVFKAKSYGVEGFEKIVVIKRILPELARSDEFVEMFIHEAKLAVRLSHANVVQVFDLGIAPLDADADAAPADGVGAGAYYMAMEYVSGVDLATLLARCRRADERVPIEMAVFVAAEVAKGLDHAHRRRDEDNQALNIVHLDVSPQNVLLSLEGEVKVTDFGIARARGALEPAPEDTRKQKLQGKFGYMSPEHASGRAVDARSDLFSLGAVLYEMLCGVNPFSAPTTFETLRRVVAGEYPPVELLRPDVPAELALLVRTSLALDPDQRFSDAGRMYEALLTFLYGQGRRFGARDLADFLARFRTPEDASQEVDLDPESAGADERTPALGRGRAREGADSGIKWVAATPTGLSGTGPVDIDRAAELGERREITALVVELPGARGAPGTADGDRAVAAIVRRGGRILAREDELLTAVFGVEEHEGRDTEVATRAALVILRSLGGGRLPSAGVHVARGHIDVDGSLTQDDRLAQLVAHTRALARVREGMCAISSAAMRQVKNLFVFEPLEGEGGSRAVPAGVSAKATLLVKEVRGPSEVFGKFVGRRGELRVVGQTIAKATRRTASVLTIRGVHGIGKSRLLAEVDRRLRKGGYNIGWHFATCLPRGTDVPFSGLQAMLQALCGVTEGDSDSRVQLVVPRLRALALHDDEVAAVLVALGATAHAPRAHAPATADGRSSPPSRGIGQASRASNARAALTNAFTRIVQSLAEDKPHVFAWDAAHAMDADSFAVLESVVTRLPNARALFVFATRAGFAHPLEALPLHVSADLADLSPAEAERLVALRLGVARVPLELMRFIRDRAGGHPQMIEEVLKGLVEARAVTAAEGAVVSMKLVGQELALPKTLRGLVASRVARLEPRSRGVLQAAAVLGDPVNVEVLARMTGADRDALERILAELEEHGLIIHASAADVLFASPIVPEVVVDALPAPATRERHQAAAGALAEVYADKGVEHAARVAAHLYAAGDRARAGTWFARSAGRRLEAGQLDGAVRDYQRAFELADLEARSSSELLGWFSGLAGALRLVRALPEALDLCQRVIARVDAAKDLEDDVCARVRVRIDAGRVLGAVHLFDAARAQFGAAEAIAQLRPERPQLAVSALLAASEFSGRQGDFKRAVTLLERLDAIGAGAGADRAEEHRWLVSLVQTKAAMGEHAAALRHFERAEALIPDEPTLACERLKLRALMAYFARDYRAAALHSEKAIDAARDLGLSYEVAVNLHNLGDTLIQAGDFARAYGAIKQSLALCDELGHERLGSYDRMMLAYLDARAKDPEAERILLQGIRYAESNDFTWDVLGGRFLLGQLRASRAELAGARQEFERVRALAEEAGNRLVVADCERELAMLRDMESKENDESVRLNVS